MTPDDQVTAAPPANPQSGQGDQAIIQETMAAIDSAIGELDAIQSDQDTQVGAVLQSSENDLAAIDAELNTAEQQLQQDIVAGQTGSNPSDTTPPNDNPNTPIAE